MRSIINLASPVVAEHRPVEKLLIIAVCVFLGVFAAAASMLGYLVYVRREVSQVAAQEARVLQQINQNPQQKVNALILKERLNNITKILASRGDVNSKITSVIALLPSSLDINAFNIDDERVMVEVTTSDLAIFDGLLESEVQKLQSNKSQAISKMTVESFQVQADDPRYTMTVSFDLTK